MMDKLKFCKFYKTLKNIYNFRTKVNRNRKINFAKFCSKLQNFNQSVFEIQLGFPLSYDLEWKIEPLFLQLIEQYTKIERVSCAFFNNAKLEHCCHSSQRLRFQSQALFFPIRYFEKAVNFTFSIKISLA